MIGLFGVFSNEQVLERTKREDAFSRMMRSVDTNDFHNTCIRGTHFSIGLTQRNNGENKDLAVKLVNDDFAAAFSGYGKMRGERKLCWAEEIIHRIIDLYEAQGPEALIQIEGSFACLIFDKGRFFIVSDRFSSKKIFYHQGPKTFVFAPDVGRVIESELVPREKDLDAAKQLLVSGFFLDDSTLARGVSRFPCANLLEGVASSAITIHQKKYWDVSATEGTIDKISPDLIIEFKEKLQSAIYELSDLEQRAVVPLSGGLDSRAIAYYVGKRQSLDTLTYDLGDEVTISQRVCKALSGSRDYFSNETICIEEFKLRLRQMVEDQRIHAVVNQYFYAPLFRRYFYDHKNKAALYDGVYMDILFSAPYTHPVFGINEFIQVYARGIDVLGNFSRNLNYENLSDLIEITYEKIQSGCRFDDGISISHKAYIEGRLRRYVLEFVSFKEDYCYVLQPGFNYDLVDFGYSLGLRLRKGLLYSELFKSIPGLANIPYKDSYGNRNKTLLEKAKDQYLSLRLKLSYGTNGLIPYFLYQTEWFFLRQNEIDSYKNMFLTQNCMTELFDDTELEHLFKQVKKKQYLFNIFQRVLFLQQFYRRYGF